jgi:hypothetical protein
VQRLKQFQLGLYQHVKAVLSSGLIQYEDKDYLSFGIYREGGEFCLKGSFRHYNYQFLFEQANSSSSAPPARYPLTNHLVRQELLKRCQQLQAMS